MRLHLIELLGLGPSPCLLPSALAHHVETGRAQRNILCYMSPLRACGRIYFGGPGENRTPVHSAFTWKELQQYRYYTTHLFMCQLEPTHHHV
jgi:hypothetical protein